MKILIIASCFAPKNVIGAIRLSKLVKYLVRQNQTITVISPVLESYDLLDKTLECREFDYIKRITVPYSRVTTFFTRMYQRGEKIRLSVNKIGSQTNNSIKDNLYRKLRDEFSNWRDFEWSRKVNKIIQSEKIVYDLVISSSPNVSTHDSAFFAKRTGKAKKWIADFRDPIVLESSVGSDRDKLVKKQSLIVQRADLVTHVSQVGTENFVCYSEDKHKVIWIPNGFDEEDLSIVSFDNCPVQENTQRVVFSYAGGLYKGERDCSPLFKAIRELVDDKLITLVSIRFDYAGKDIGILIEQAERYGVASIIRDRGFITRDKSIAMQQASDCVVVATFCYADHGGAMTGKIYEPVMMEKYILLLVSGKGMQSEPGAFIKDLNAGAVYEESENHGDVAVIKRMILKMIEDKKNNGCIRPAINEERRIKYSYKYIVKELMYTLNKL